MSKVVGSNTDGTPHLESMAIVTLGKHDHQSIRPSIVTCGPSEKWGSTASGSSPSNVTATLEVCFELAGSSGGIRRYHLFTDTRHKFTTRVCLAVPLASDRDAVADFAKHEE